MGKNSVMKTAGKIIGNVVLHKLLVKHTNRPESAAHLQSEEVTYRDAAIKEAKKYNWNDRDKNEIKQIALEFIYNKHFAKYPDVQFSNDEAEKYVENEIIDLKL
jgi:hypothetical protein